MAVDTRAKRSSAMNFGDGDLTLPEVDGAISRADRHQLCGMYGGLAIPGPYRVASGQAFVAGAKAGQAFTAGAKAGQAFVAGAETGQGHANPATAGQGFVAGSITGQTQGR